MAIARTGLTFHLSLADAIHFLHPFDSTTLSLVLVVVFFFEFFGRGFPFIGDTRPAVGEREKDGRGGLFYDQQVTGC